MANVQDRITAARLARRSARKRFKLPSRAKQSFKDECDINVIMAKYKERGIVTHVTRYNGHYGDLPNEVDYHTNLQSVMDADEAFKSLPAKLRARFHNDPAEFVGFILNPENQSEIDKLGLGQKPANNNLPGNIPPPAPEPDPPPPAPPPAE